MTEYYNLIFFYSKSLFHQNSTSLKFSLFSKLISNSLYKFARDCAFRPINGARRSWSCDSFWATVCKTILFMLSDPCPVCLSVQSVCHVCSVDVLWPNGWMDQDETWHAGRPRPWPHCVYGNPAPAPPKGHSPPFWPISVVAKWLDGSKCHLVWR